MVIVRTLGGGDIAFLTTTTRRSSAALADSPVRRQCSQDGAQEWFAVHGGFVEVVAQPGDHPLRRRRARRPTSTSAVRTRREPGPRRPLRANPDDEDAQAALTRAEVRLEVAGAA